MAAKQSGTNRTILIADDHEVYRFGLASLLRRTLEASNIVEAERFEVALEQLRDPGIFLALIDLGMPGLASPQELAEVRRRRPDVRLIVLTGSAERQDILQSLEAGVHGYIVKSARTDTMVDHIRHVLAGEIYVPPILAELPRETAHDAATVSAPRVSAPLTARQREVLRLIAEGLTNKEIGRTLKIAEGTVKMHLREILRAVGASNRAHAAVIGRQFLD